MNEQKIINKIKKLFALSSSPNENEAVSALDKARALLAEYSLDASEIGIKASNVFEEEIPIDSELADWQLKLIACITASTYTEALVESEENKRIIKIIGRKANAASARYLYEYLDSALRKTGDKFKMAIDDLAGFRLGMVENIKKRLNELNRKPASAYSKDLIPKMDKIAKKENAEYLAKTYGEIENKEFNGGVDPNSFGLGERVGAKIALNSQIDRRQGTI